MLFGAEVITTYKRVRLHVQPESLSRYVGKWNTVIAEELWNFEFTAHDGKLFRRIDDSPEMEVIPEAGNKFYYSDGQDKVFAFVPDASGAIKEAWFIMNGLKYPLARTR